MSSSARRSSRPAWIALALFVAALGVFRASPRGQLYDSRYAMLVSQQLLATGSPRLDPFVEQLGGVDAAGEPRDYRIVRTGGAYHWFYAPGTPLLSAPFVGLASALGRGPVDAAGRYDRDAERRLERWLAAATMALAGVLFFFTARAWLPERASALVAAAALFGSPIWSTASRSLWSQTYTILLVAAAVLLLARAERRGAPLRAGAIATLLALAWLCRPTAAVPALAVAAWTALRRRESLARLVGTGALWLAVFLLGFRAAYGGLLPPYHEVGRHAFTWMPEALLGNWLSPARGLLVYCPVAALVAGLAIARARTLPSRSLAALAAVAISLHWLLVSSHAPWWGGYGYGARMMAETVPFWVVLAAQVWAASPAPASERSPRAAAVAAAVLVALGVLLNGIGAISRAAADWNHRQAEPGFEAVLWSLREAPFLAPLARPRGGPDA